MKMFTGMFKCVYGMYDFRILNNI